MHCIYINQECDTCGKKRIDEVSPEEYGSWVQAGKPLKSICQSCFVKPLPSEWNGELLMLPDQSPLWFEQSQEPTNE